jgi:hypothetical protein
MICTSADASGTPALNFGFVTCSKKPSLDRSSRMANMAASCDGARPSSSLSSTDLARTFTTPSCTRTDGT